MTFFSSLLLGHLRGIGWTPLAIASLLTSCTVSHIVEGNDASTSPNMIRPDAAVSEADANASEADASASEADASASEADAGTAPDARASLLDASREDAAAPPDDCFADEVIVGTATSRVSLDGFTALEDGWLASWVGAPEPGSTITRLDAGGNVVGIARRRLPGGRWIRIGSSVVTASFLAIQRFDLVGNEILAYAEHDVGWGGVLALERRPSGGLRMVSYAPHDGVDDLRLHITDIELDDTAVNGFSLREGTLPPDLTTRLGPHFQYMQYYIQGDFMRAIRHSREHSTEIDEWQTMLIQMTFGGVGAHGETVGWRLWENATWDTERFHFRGLTSDWSGMVATRSEPSGAIEGYVAPIPGHDLGLMETVSLGPGEPRVLDETIAMIDHGSVRFYDRHALVLRGELAVTGEVLEIAQRGTDAAVLSSGTEPSGEIQLRLRCVRLDPR
jgi:hypothetical protein